MSRFSKTKRNPKERREGNGAGLPKQGISLSPTGLGLRNSGCCVYRPFVPTRPQGKQKGRRKEGKEKAAHVRTTVKRKKGGRRTTNRENRKVGEIRCAAAPKEKGGKRRRTTRRPPCSVSSKTGSQEGQEEGTTTTGEEAAAEEEEAPAWPCQRFPWGEEDPDSRSRRCSHSSSNNSSNRGCRERR